MVGEGRLRRAISNGLSAILIKIILKPHCYRGIIIKIILFRGMSCRRLAGVLPVSCRFLAAGRRARLCPFDLVFGAICTIFRAEYAPLSRIQ